MTEFKGTSGPWFIKYDEDFYPERAVITSESRAGMIDIAIIEAGNPETGMDEPFQSEQSANVHLIAAAPDLLEALKAALAPGVLTTYHAKLARAAIVKALGESV